MEQKNQGTQAGGTNRETRQYKQGQVPSVGRTQEKYKIRVCSG